MVAKEEKEIWKVFFMCWSAWFVFVPDVCRFTAHCFHIFIHLHHYHIHSETFVYSPLCKSTHFGAFFCVTPNQTAQPLLGVFHTTQVMFSSCTYSPSVLSHFCVFFHRPYCKHFPLSWHQPPRCKK